MKARRLFEGICVAFSLIFFSCEKIDVVDNPVKQDGTDVMSLSLKGNDGLEYKSFFINDSTIHVVVPKQYDCSGLTSIVNHNALHASIDDVELNEHVRFDFSDFKSPKELKVVSSLGEGKKYKIVVHDLPVIVIDTPDNRAIDSKTERVEGWEDKMPSYIDNLYNEIHRAAERNEKMWPDWHTLNYPDDKSYHELIDDMKNSLYSQLSWLDEEISKF